MDGHGIRAGHVCRDEPVSRTHCIHTAIRLAGGCELFHVDRQGQELPADDHQCCSNNPMRGGPGPALQLTIKEQEMAGKATSVYLTVTEKTTHKTVFQKTFFNMTSLKDYVKTPEFKTLYPEEQYNIIKETY